MQINRKYVFFTYDAIKIAYLNDKEYINLHFLMIVKYYNPRECKQFFILHRRSQNIISKVLKFLFSLDSIKIAYCIFFS